MQIPSNNGGPRNLSNTATIVKQEVSMRNKVNVTASKRLDSSKSQNRDISDNEHKERPLMTVRIKFKSDSYVSAHVYRDDTA